MLKIKNGGLDQYGALDPLNSSNLKQLASKGLNTDQHWYCNISAKFIASENSVCLLFAANAACQLNQMISEIS